MCVWEIESHLETLHALWTHERIRKLALDQLNAVQHYVCGCGCGCATAWVVCVVVGGWVCKCVHMRARACMYTSAWVCVCVRVCGVRHVACGV